MIKINLKRNDCFEKINSQLLKQKQAFQVDKQNKLYVILGEPKNSKLVDWFLELDSECIITYASDSDTDAEVIEFLHEIDKIVFERPDEILVRFLSQMQEFSNCRFSSVKDYSEDIIEILFGQKRNFKAMYNLVYNTVICDDVSKLDISKEHQYMFDTYLQNFCRTNHYKKIKFKEFLKMLKSYFEDNRE